MPPQRRHRDRHRADRLGASRDTAAARNDRPQFDLENIVSRRAQRFVDLTRPSVLAKCAGLKAFFLFARFVHFATVRGRTIEIAFRPTWSLIVSTGWWIGSIRRVAAPAAAGSTAAMRNIFAPAAGNTFNSFPIPGVIFAAAHFPMPAATITPVARVFPGRRSLSPRAPGLVIRARKSKSIRCGRWCKSSNTAGEFLSASRSAG